jgi:hypothetical protein
MVLAMQIPPSCRLDAAGMREQRARYANLAGSVTSYRRKADVLEIEFDDGLQIDMLEQLIAVERECCPFFRLSFDREGKRLRVTVDDPEMLPALEAIAHGFSPPASTDPARRGARDRQ